MNSIFDLLLNFDLNVFQWIQNIQNPVLNWIMVAITTVGNAGIIFIVLGFVLLFTKKHRKEGLTVLIALIIMLLFNDLFLKEFFARIRPFNLYESNPEKYILWGTQYTYPNLVYKPSSYSFPSGHTASAFAAAVAVLLNNRKTGIPVIIFAFIMGFSRIYVQVHYSTDVIGGIIIGAICAIVASVIAKYLFPIIDNALDELFAKIKNRNKQ